MWLSCPIALSQDPPASPPPAVEDDASALRVAGFGDVDFTSRGDAGHSGFELGALDLYLTSELSSRWSALAELVFEDDEGALRTDLERATLSFEPSSRIKLTAGRLHSPIVRWNVKQHHGVFLQTPIERPAMARFEDAPGLWPLHFVGLVASGQLGSRAGVGYLVGVGNGRGRIPDEIQVVSDRNGSKAVIAELSAAPLLGLELAVAGYLDEIPADAGPLSERDLTISVSYEASGVEAMAEWARMSHRPKPAGTASATSAWYVLASRRLPGAAERVRPYLFFDDLRVAGDEPFVAAARSERSYSLGARIDVTLKAALKLELRSRRLGDRAARGEFRAQAAFSF